MPRVIQSPEARIDLKQIVRYIACRNESAARKWRRQMSGLFQMLARFPGVGERRTTAAGLELRRFSSRGYVVYFRPAEEDVVILRIFHGSRDYEQLIE